MSIGVQDFDPDVQHAVNRIQSEGETLEVINAARANGFQSVNVDLIYGLPKQTLVGFKPRWSKVIAAEPDRIALYNYAHLPALFQAAAPHQRSRSARRPKPAETARSSRSPLSDAGYRVHRHGSFREARRRARGGAAQGRLHRNFQGYSTHADCDLSAGRERDRQHRADLQPELPHARRVLQQRSTRNTLPIMRGSNCRRTICCGAR